MNYFKLIPVIWKAKGIVNDEIKEAKMETASGKAGWKSTEFWFQAATQIATLWGAVSGFIPPKYAAIISTAGVALYTVARTIAKAVSDIQAAKAETTTTTVTPAPAVVTTTSPS